MSRRVIEQPAEDRGTVETRQAQPVHRTVGRDQGGGVAVGQKRVRADGNLAHAGVPIMATSPPTAGAFPRTAADPSRQRRTAFMPVASWWVHTRRDRSGRESAAHRRSTRPGSRRRSQSRRSEGSSREPLSGDRARDRCRQSWFGRQASDPGKVTGPYRLAPGGPERPGSAVHADQGPDQGLRRVPSIRRDGQAEWRLNLRQKDTPVERPTPSGPPAGVSSLSRRPPPAEPPSRRAFASGTAAATGLSLSGGYLAPPRYPRPTSRPPD